MEITSNNGQGLQRGVHVSIAGKDLEITVLNVEEAREGWVKLQPWMNGIMMAEDLKLDDKLVLAGIRGGLTDEALKHFMSVFGKRTSYVVTETAVSGTEVESKRFLSEKGQLDACFAGEWEAVMDWLEVCVQLNFGKQILKQHASLAKRQAAIEAKAEALTVRESV